MAEDASTDGDAAAVSELMAATGCTRDQAAVFLEANAGDAQTALAMYYEQVEIQRPPPPPRPAAGPSPTRAAVPPRARARTPALPAAGPLGVLVRVFRLPFGLLRATFNLTFRTLGLGWDVLTFLSHRFLPATVLRAIRGGSRALAGSGEILEPRLAAAHFIAAFHEQYGATCPAWQESSWQEAATRAHREFKFLFVYLHSTEHQDTAAFCRDVLCDPGFVEYVSENFVAWGGDVCHSDAFTLAQSLRSTTYPYVALLLGSSSRLRLVLAVGGNSFGPAALHARLASAVEDHGAALVVERSEAAEREMNRQLREQQDAEYQESLARDREREQAVAAERAAAEAAQAAAAMEAAAVAAAAAAEAQRQADFRAALEERRNAAFALVTPDPAAGALGACSVRIRMPDGTNLQRRFLAADAVQALYHYVDIQEGFDVLAYNLVSNFPRCVYDGDKRTATIGDAGLAGAMLYIQSLDD